MVVSPAKPPDGEQLRLGQLEQPGDDGGAGDLCGEDRADSEDRMAAGHPVKREELNGCQAQRGDAEESHGSPRGQSANAVFDGMEDRQLAEEGEEARKSPERLLHEDHETRHEEQGIGDYAFGEAAHRSTVAAKARSLPKGGLFDDDRAPEGAIVEPGRLHPGAFANGRQNKEATFRESKPR